MEETIDTGSNINKYVRQCLDLLVYEIKSKCQHNFKILELKKKTNVRYLRNTYFTDNGIENILLALP